MKTLFTAIFIALLLLIAIVSKPNSTAIKQAVNERMASQAGPVGQLLANVGISDYTCSVQDHVLYSECVLFDGTHICYGFFGQVIF
jgi:hypothetical protein